MLLAGADAHVDDLAVGGGGARRYANDHLAGVLATAELVSGLFSTHQLAVDVGITAQFLHEGDAYRDRVCVAFADHVEGFGTEANGQGLGVFGS